MGKVSVIIAAYNIEQYIERCVESIINQTYKNLEIIVINDGSTDRTLEIIKGIKKKDERIKIIDQENIGLSNSRKRGYSIASGEYISFVDGDDWLDVNAIERLYNVASVNKLDILCYGFINIYDNKKFVKPEEVDETVELLKGDTFLKRILLCKIPPSICLKFLRKNYIEKECIEFPEGITYAEDLALSGSIACSMPKVGIIKDKLYYYYQRENSVTKKISPKILDIAKATSFVKNNMISKNVFDNNKEEFDYCIYLHNFDFRYDEIFNKNIYSKKLFDNWKSFNVNITKNIYYKNLIRSASTKGKLICNLKTKNYYMACLLNKIF